MRRKPSSLLLVLGAALGAACSPEPPRSSSPLAYGDAGAPSNDAAIARDDRWLVDVTAESGVDLVRTELGALGARMAGGLCAFDADGDGALDLLFAEPASDGGTRFFRGLGGLRFEDATSGAGFAGVDAMGCLAADLDADGDDDVVLTGFGMVRLLRNDGGTFVDASDRLVVELFDDVLYTAAVAFDPDRDGDLDLAIASYGRYHAPAPGFDCGVPCPIDNGLWFEGATKLLVQGPDGRLVNAPLSIVADDEAALVLLATDLDADAKPDLFVGYDSATAKDQYLRRGPSGVLRDGAEALGVAFNARLGGVWSMSASDGDVDGDGQLDLLQSSWEDDFDALYTCTGKGAATRCRDVAEELELFRTPRILRWGQAIADLDDDGVVELLEATGHVYRAEELVGSKPIALGPLAGPLLLWTRASAKDPFRLAPKEAGLARETTGRGLVVADFDGDGALDAVVAPALGPALVMKGVHAPRGHWLGVTLSGKGKNTRAIGAQVTVVTGERRIPAIVHAGQGYLSSVDAPLHFGLGAASAASIEVRWPSGAITTTAVAAVDRVLTLVEP